MADNRRDAATAGISCKDFDILAKATEEPSSAAIKHFSACAACQRRYWPAIHAAATSGDTPPATFLPRRSRDEEKERSSETSKTEHPVFKGLKDLATGLTLGGYNPNKKKGK